MVSKVEKAEGPSGGDGQADLGSLMDANGETFRAIMKANEAMLEGMAAMGREIMEFRNERTRRDIETSESLMRCNDLEEAFRLQCDYAREASQQYFEEASRLMNLTAKIAREYWAPLEDRTREALHDLNAEAAAKPE